jgi:hypothetical protein
VPRTCFCMLARGESDRSLTGAWGRVQPPMEAFPPPNGRSSSKESKSGAIFLNRSWEAPVLSFKRCGGTRRVNIVAGTFSGAWRRVVSPMEVFPPYNNRSGDDLSVGGGLGLSRCLERRFRRSWWLGRAWWRVGS